MSEEKVQQEAKASTEVKFNGGFEVSTSTDGVELSYKDKDVFENHLPIKKADAKAYDKYKGSYINSFVTAAAEEIKSKMVKNEKLEKGTASAPFGMHSQGSVEVNVQRSYEQRIPNFDNPSESKTVKVSRITVKVKDQFVQPSKSHVKQIASDLTKELIK